MTTLQEGETAPDFDLPTDSGGRLSLSSLKGKPIVVYFYPKDDTSGCTREAIDFSTLAPDFARLGATVVGISPDPTKSHVKFRDKHKLSVTLASDENKAVLERYGVWAEKSMYGRRYMGVERTTVLVDSQGRIARIWRKVKVAGHAEEVLAAVKALTGR
jgi:peroxiredoxin Q/BCP